MKEEKNKEEKNVKKKKNRDTGAVFTKVMASFLVILMLASTIGGLVYYLIMNAQ